MIDGSQFKTRTALEDYSVQLLNDKSKAFVATEIFTPKYVEKDQTKKYQYDLTMLRDVETLSSSKSEANEVDYGVFTSNITTYPHKLKGSVDPRDVKNADAAVANMKLDQAENITSRMLIRMERKAVALATDSTNYPSALTSTLAAGSTWLDAAGDPEYDSVVAANAVKLRCMRVPNAAAMSGTTFRLLRTSPAFRERIKYTSGGPVSEEAIAAFLGVKKLVICDAVYNSAIPGAADSVGDIWDDSVLFFVQETNPGLRSVGYGHTWIVKDFYTYEYEDQKIGSGAGRLQWIEMGMEYEMGAGAVVSSSDGDFIAGYLLKNVV